MWYIFGGAGKENEAASRFYISIIKLLFPYFIMREFLKDHTDFLSELTSQRIFCSDSKSGMLLNGLINKNGVLL